MKKNPQQQGGAALEYLIVSACALVMGLAAAGFIGNIFHEKLEEVRNAVDQDWNADWSDWQN